MRKLYFMCAAAACAVMLTISVSAAFDGEKETQGLYSALPSDAADIVSEAKRETGYDLDFGINALIAAIKEALAGMAAGILRDGLKLFAIALVCGGVSALCREAGNVCALAVDAAGVLAVASVGVMDISGLIGSAQTLIENLNVFSKALLPSMTAAAAAAGAAGAAVARQAAAMFFSDLLVTLTAKVFLPLLYIYIAVRMVGLISENPFFAKLGGAIKSLILNSLKFLLTLYFAYMTISGLIGGAADTLLKKATKTAVSSAVPVVGGIISEAAESVFAGAIMVKNTLGVFGVIGVLACALTPLMTIGLSALAAKGGALLSSAVCEKGAAPAAEVVAEGMGMMFAMSASIIAVLIVEIVACMRIGA